MADRAIYPANAPDPRLWGERYYYANARRDGGVRVARGQPARRRRLAARRGHHRGVDFRRPVGSGHAARGAAVRRDPAAGERLALGRSRGRDAALDAGAQRARAARHFGRRRAGSPRGA